MPKHIVVVADIRKTEVKKYLADVKPWLEKKAHVCGWLTRPQELPAHIPGCDFVMVLGGDGLLILVAHQLAGKQIPIIGVNFGRLGFLTEITLAEFFTQLTQMLEGQPTIVQRMMLQCQIERAGTTIHSSLAVNDVIIKSASVARMLYTTVWIDDEEISTYGGDGLIIATPVGSTAYSLSAGGPIVSPNLAALIITPICPHVLTLRPLVITADRRIKIGLMSQDQDAIASIDGQVNIPLQPQDRILVSQAQESFYLAQLNRCSFYHTLQEKLTWGETRVNHKNMPDI